MATPATKSNSPSPYKESEETTDPLSRLRQYPQRKPNWNYEPSPSLAKKYASTADSVQQILIYELTFWKDANVEAMVDLANNAFASLDWLNADYSDLYAAVRDYISYYCQYSEAKKELKRNQNDVSDLENLCGRLKEAEEALNKADAELSNAMKGFSSLRSWMGENSVLLGKVLGENTKVKSEVDVLRDDCDFGSLCSGIVKRKAAVLEFAKQVEEKREIVKKIKPQYDEAEVGVERSTKALLSFWKK